MLLKILKFGLKDHPFGPDGGNPVRALLAPGNWRGTHTFSRGCSSLDFAQEASKAKEGQNGWSPAHSSSPYTWLLEQRGIRDVGDPWGFLQNAAVAAWWAQATYTPAHHRSEVRWGGSVGRGLG